MSAPRGPWSAEVDSVGGDGGGRAVAEIPIGRIDGVNTQFVLANPPIPSSSLWGFLNNGAIFQPDDFTVNGNVVMMTVAPKGGQIPDIVRFFYRY